MPPPFVVKNWQDYPATTTPRNAAALKDQERRLADYTDSLTHRAVVPGLVIGHIGDSHAYNGNDLTRFNAGMMGYMGPQSVLLWACLQSGGRLVFGGGFGVYGYKVSEILPQVTQAKNAGCQAVLISVGTNNNGPVTLAQTIIDYMAVISAVIAAGMVPVLSTLPPRNEQSGNTTFNEALNSWLRRQAVSYGFPLVDNYGLLAAVSGGQYASGYNADTLHMNGKGARVMGAGLWDALKPLVPPGPNPLLVSEPVTNANVIVPNGLFQSTAGSGGTLRPSNINMDGALTTQSLAPDASIGRGNIWKFTRNTASGNGAAYASVTHPLVSGHRYLLGMAMSASVEAAGITWSLTWNNANYYLTLPSMNADVPAGSALAVLFTAQDNSGVFPTYMSLDAGASGGQAAIGQLTLRDLTAEGSY